MPKFQKFNDGIVEIYSVENIAEKGDRPKEGLKIKKRLRFEYQTIGVKRNFEAKQAQVKLTELICVPLHRDISPQDIVVLCGRQYSIEQAQHDKETLPPITKLSLTKLEADYEFKTV